MSAGRVAPSRIVLVRHGRSALPVHRAWVDARGVFEWRAAYDAAGIAADDAPPASLVEEASRADVIIASDLPRATASAERIAPGRRVVCSPLLRESDLDVPEWVPRRWPLRVWEACIHLQWGYRILRREDLSPAELARSIAAAEWLGAHAQEGARVVAVTHGVFRRFLARQLLAKGWRPERRLRSYRTWSAWTFHTEMPRRRSTTRL